MRRILCAARIDLQQTHVMFKRWGAKDVWFSAAANVGAWGFEKWYCDCQHLLQNLVESILRGKKSRFTFFFAMGLGIKNYTATRYSINRMEKSQKNRGEGFCGEFEIVEEKNYPHLATAAAATAAASTGAGGPASATPISGTVVAKRQAGKNKCYWCGLCFLHKILLIRAGTRNAWEIYNSMYNIYWDFHENLSENENGFRSNYLTSRNVTQGGRSLFFIW